MAATIATSPRRKTYRWQAMMWLIMTLACGVLTALVWMYSQATTKTASIENAPLNMAVTNSVDNINITQLDSLHELDNDVQPIDFEAMVRDLRQYPDEFKDKRYLLANKGKWTVQVMNVSEHDVIVDYLAGRKDRNKFAYFRYRDENNQLRYMLTYGVMSSPQEALGGARIIDFGLPANVRVLPEEINRYVSIIDNYELAEPVTDLSANRARQIKLQPTRREVPVRRRAEPVSEESTSALSNTEEQASQTAPSRLAETANNRSIRRSEDTSDTLAVVQEQRVLDNDAATAATTSNNRAGNTKAKADSSQTNNRNNSQNNTQNNAKNNNQARQSSTTPAQTQNANRDANNNSANNSVQNTQVDVQESRSARAEQPTNSTTNSANPPPAVPNNRDMIRELIEQKNNSFVN